MSTSENENLLSREPPGGGMSCDQARRQIERLIEECDLKDVERALLLAHVRTCGPCKAELESERRLEGRLKEAFVALDTRPSFTARVLSSLPEPGSRDAPDWEAKRTAAVHDHTGRGVFPAGRIRVARRDWVLRRRVAWAAGCAALLVLGCGLAVLWCCRQQAGEAPTVAEITGAAARERGGAPLKAGDTLLPDNGLVAPAEPVEVLLRCGPHRVARVALAPRAKLQALSRNRYRLVNGVAYFQVRTDRLKAVSAEVFEVDAGGIATVRVTGTTFGIELGEAGQGGAAVYVEEGSVQVEQAGLPSTAVVAGQELRLAASRALTLHPFNKAQRTAWLAALNPQPKPQPAAIQPPAANLPPPAAVVPVAPRDLNWDELVREVPLLDRNLAEGTDALAEALGRKPPQLLQLREQLQGPFIASTATLSFAVHNEMPLQAVLRWMARDVSARLDLGADGRAPRFVTAAANELPGPPDSGIPPEEIHRALETPWPGTLRTSAPLPKAAEALSARSGVTMIFDRPLVEKYSAAVRNGNLELAGQTVGQKLDALLGVLQASAAWYDHALYIAAPARIEELTQVARCAAPGPQLLGEKLNPLWARELQDLLAGQTYPAAQAGLALPGLGGVRGRSDAKLAGRPVLSRLVLDPSPAEGPVFRYSTGMLGEALAAAVLGRLQSGSPPVPGTTALMSQPAATGAVPDLESLMKQVQPFLRVEFAPGVKPQPFSKHALVNKNLRLGEALEWAAWLSGCGVRQEANETWVVDDAAVCYGPREMQVLSLAQLAARNPSVSSELPKLCVRLLPELYPTWFAKTRFRCVGNRLVFTGDRRQLQLAQRLRTALEAECPPGAQAAQTWKPSWRAAVEKNLGEPFRGATAKLSGTFAGLLRFGELSPQLRCTVLVDVAAMREKAGVEIQDLDTAGLSVGQVVERLAQAAGLKMTLEGEVVWLRP